MNYKSSLTLIFLTANRFIDWQKMDLNKMDDSMLAITGYIFATSLMALVVECNQWAWQRYISITTIQMLKGCLLISVVAHLCYSKVLAEQVIAVFFIFNAFLNFAFALYQKFNGSKDSTQKNDKSSKNTKMKHGKSSSSKHTKKQQSMRYTKPSMKHQQYQGHQQNLSTSSASGNIRINLPFSN